MWQPFQFHLYLPCFWRTFWRKGHLGWVLKDEEELGKDGEHQPEGRSDTAEPEAIHHCFVQYLFSMTREQLVS